MTSGLTLEELMGIFVAHCGVLVLHVHVGLLA